MISSLKRHSTVAIVGIGAANGLLMGCVQYGALPTIVSAIFAGFFISCAYGLGLKDGSDL